MNFVVLLSHSSTGCISPFFLLGSHPYAFFLYKACNESNRFLDDCFERFDRFIEKGYLYMPTSVENFEDTLKEIKDKVQSIK